MLPLLIVIAAECLLLGALVVLREPKLLIPMVVLGLPMEVLETELLGTLGKGGLTGAARSLLNPGQATMIAVVGVGVIRARHNPLKLIPNSSLVVPLAAVVLVFFLGVAWSDSRVPAASVLILPMYLAFVFVAPTLIEDRRDLDRIVVAFLAAACVLAVIAVAQRLFGVFNWRGVLVQSDAYSYRANGTFADPNILARFLALSMALGAGLVLATGPRRTTVYLAIPALAFGAIGIVATASRSGWLALVFCGFIVVLLAPIARYRKALLVGSAVGGLAAFLTFVLLQGGTDADRVRSLTAGVAVIGQRDFLIRAGWEMFKDSPIVGLGSGNYEHAISVTYINYVPQWAHTRLSHTSLISILAELGLLGLALLGFVFMRTGVVATKAYRRETDNFHRMLTGWLGAALLTVFLHSQSEGRFFEEPYLWVLLALLIAVETRPGIAAAQPEAGTAPTPVRPATTAVAGTAATAGVGAG